MTWCLAEQQYKHELLLQAIEDSRCPYCKAQPGELCRTVKGRKPGTVWSGLVHMGRVENGHCFLVEVKDPLHTSESICRFRKTIDE